MTTTLIGYLDNGKTVLCRALAKKTTRYQDQVKTRCGFTIVLPVALQHEGVPTCPQCRAKEKI